MNPVAVLRGVSERVGAGRSPSYTEAHVLKALEMVSERAAGRAALGRGLGLGEGAVRTMIKHLRGAGLIRVTRRGVGLTERGGRVLARIHGVISRGVEAPEGPHTVAPYNYAVLVRGAADHVRLGVEQRDAALMAGARGATTLLYDGARFRMPGVVEDIDPSLNRFLIDRLRPEEGDVAIIGTADTPLAAEIGAKSAAIELFREMTGRLRRPEAPRPS